MTEEIVTVDDILSRLDKNTLSMLRKGSEISREILPTASFGLNLTLGGGMRTGKQHTWWGGEQSGKTTFMLQTIGINQALYGHPCAWIDGEHSFDPAWAERLGVDTEKLIVTEVSTISELTDLQVKLVRAGIKILTIDSTSALMPKSYFDKTGEMKNFEETGQLGQMAKDLGQMCKMVQGVNYTCAINHISQVRIDVGASSMQKPFKPVGGKEVEHTDSLRVRLFSSKAEAQAIMGKATPDSIEEQIGRKVTWKIDKNKINGKYGVGEYNLYTLGDHVGVEKNSELVQYGIKYGIIVKAGAWYKVYGEQFQGEPKTINYLNEHPEVAEKLEAEIYAKSV